MQTQWLIGYGWNYETTHLLVSNWWVPCGFHFPGIAGRIATWRKPPLVTPFQAGCRLTHADSNRQTPVWLHMPLVFKDVSETGPRGHQAYQRPKPGKCKLQIRGIVVTMSSTST